MKTKTIYKMSAALVVAAWVFAPLVTTRGAYTASCGYRFIETCSDGALFAASLDWPILLTEWIGIGILTWLVIQACGEE